MFGDYDHFATIPRVPEPAWHRNQRSERQRARGLLSAAKLGVDIDTKAIQSAAQRLSCHHGSSVGAAWPLQMGPPPAKGQGKGGVQGNCNEWQCSRCRGKDGKPFANRATRTHCMRCNVHKGQCYGGDCKPGGNPAKSLAQRQVDQAKQQDKQLKKENEKLKKELEQLKTGSLETLGASSRAPDADPKGPNFQRELNALKEKRQACEKFGFIDELTKVQREIKALEATKAATIPEGERLKRAEQELAKRCKQSTAVEEELAEAKRKVEELEKKKLEMDIKKAEAEAERDRVKKLIADPGPTATAGSTWSFKEQGLAMLATVELHSPSQAAAMQQILELVGKDLAEAAKQTEAAKKAEEEKSREAVEAAPGAPVRTADGAAPAGTAFNVSADTASDSTEAELMELCISEESTIAERAKQTLEDLREAKRRKTLST